VGIDIFSFPGVPIPFISFIAGKDEEGIKDLLQECNENLSRAFFDKNGCKEFWKLSEIIIGMVKDNPEESVSDIYGRLESKIKIKTTYLTPETVQYMISLIKTGLDNAG
jgi:hypothetical protein